MSVDKITIHISGRRKIYDYAVAPAVLQMEIII